MSAQLASERHQRRDGPGVRLYCRAVMLAVASKGLEGLAVAAGSGGIVGGKCRGR